MFTTQLDAAVADPRVLLELGREVMVQERMAGCRKLQVAAAWADCHGTQDDGDAGPRSALVDNVVQLGGRGTPLVAEDCAGELAMVWQTSVFAARSWIADALTIRHRLRVSRTR